MLIDKYLASSATIPRNFKISSVNREYKLNLTTTLWRQTQKRVNYVSKCKVLYFTYISNKISINDRHSWGQVRACSNCIYLIQIQANKLQDQEALIYMNVNSWIQDRTRIFKYLFWHSPWDIHEFFLCSSILLRF